MRYCDKCNHTGFIFKEIDGYRTAFKCECYALELAKERLKHSGMLADKTFDNFDPYNKGLQQIKEVCENYTPDKSLMILGLVGTGKTHLSMAIGNKLLSENVPVVYMGYRNAINEMKYNLIDRELYDRLIYPFKHTKILIIDDLFKGGQSEAELKILYEIVDYRYKKGLNFIVSSEKGKDDLLAIDQAIVSRIIESAKGNIIEIKGIENYRLRR